MNNDKNIVELIDSEGESIFFEHLMTLTYKEQDYVVLGVLPEDSEDSLDSELEVAILRVEVDDDGNDVYVSIEDRDELDEVIIAYDEIINSDIYR